MASQAEVARCLLNPAGVPDGSPPFYGTAEQPNKIDQFGAPGEMKRYMQIMNLFFYINIPQTPK